MRTACAIAAVALAAGLGGCGKPSGGSAPSGPAGAEGGTSSTAPLPTTIEMGRRRIGAFDVSASREYGECYPGANLPCALAIVADPGAPAITSVRVWIGYEDPARALSSIVEAAEDQSDPTTWHVTAMIPAPYPDGGQLWVQIVTGGEEIRPGAFNLIQ